MLLVVLLCAFGLLAGVTGCGIGTAIHDDQLIRGIFPGLLWAAPYLLSALFCWYGADRFWYTVAQSLGSWGAVIAGGALYFFPRMRNFGGSPMPPLGGLLWILLALLAGNATIFFAARGEEQRHLGDGQGFSYLFRAGVPLWFMVTLLVG